MNRLRTGFAAIAGLYLVACVITIGVGRHPLRPLYEGIGPAAPYRWVHPPAAFKSTNVAPITTSQTLELTGAGSEPSGAGTIDGQVVLALPAGAVRPSGGQQGVQVTISPKDPAKLGPLPPGLYSDGNAYLITASYQPSNATVGAATKPINAVIRTPVSSTALLFTTDGRTWTRIPDQHIPTQASVAASFTTFGYLLAAADAPVVDRTSSSSWTSVVLLGSLGLAAVVLISVSVLWRSGRRRRPDSGRGSGPSRRR